MASVIHATAHGLVAGSAFKFSNVLPTDCGVDTTVTYYVLASGLTANDFQFSTTPGGAAFILDLPITGGDLVGPDSYTPIVDSIQDPPTTPPTPSAVTLASAIVSGITRLRVTLNDTAEVKVRLWEVQVTHKFNDEQPIAGTATGTASTDTISLTAHGLVAGD